MTKTKSTKRALLLSALSLLMCVSMLIGSTFAWFTDSVTSGNNKIVAGTLDVDLYLWEDANTSTEITNESDPIFGEAGLAQNSTDTLWEPGKTQVVYLSIKNNGNLDLKYKVALNVVNPADGKDLYKVMQYDIIEDATYGSVTAWNATDAESVVIGTNATQANDVELKAGAEHKFALAIHMDELAGNEYQGGKVNFDLTVLATQLASESDSFNNQYDKDADYTASVGTADELKAALAAGGNVVLTNNITIDEAFAVPAGVTVNLDLNGNTITANNGYAFLLIGCDMTVKNGTVDAKDLYAFMVGSSLNSIPANLTIESGTFKGVTSAVNLCYGTVTINGGYFEATPYNGSYEFTLNCIDRTYKAGNANIIVKGGTFYKFNPADNAAEGVGTNFVADGYTATENGDGTWTVSAPTEVEVNTAADLLEAIADGGNVKIVSDITLSEKTTSSSICAVVDKEVTIDLNGHDITSPDVVFYVLEGGKLTINGDGNLISGNGGSGAAVNVYAYGGEVIINGGTYSLNRSYPNDHGADMIYAHNGGTITINGGTFKYAENVWTLNLKDNTGSAIVVKGGTFEGFNPANNVSEGLNTNFVADGYVATENNGTWTVTAE